jgi:tetratricopeptide (TPR) repeat protein/DNA-binding CsgD family transcriptional regulator
MLDSSSSLKANEEIYTKHLEKISGIHFTKREIDVIACIVHNRGNQNIAFLLSITSRGVAAHIQNIRVKLNYVPRDGIIDFIENSGKRKCVEQYYSQLLCTNSFIKYLKIIGTKVNKNQLTCSLICDSVPEQVQPLIDKIKKHLAIANILLKLSCESSKIITGKVIIRTNIEENINIGKVKPALIIDFVSQQLDSSEICLSIGDENQYNLAILELLQAIITKPEIKQIQESYVKENNALKESFKKDSSSFVHNNPAINSKSRDYKLAAIIIVVCCTIAFSISQNQVNLHPPESFTKTRVPRSINWNLPPLIEHFILRPKIMEAISKKFNSQSSGELKIVSLYGPGGIGKSVIAASAIYKSTQEYNTKIWFKADCRDMLQDQYVSIGEKYNLFPENIKLRRKISIVKEWLNNRKNILLVYDNTPDLDSIQEFLPSRGSILITSKNYKLPHAIEIDVMDTNVAYNLMYKLLPKRNKNTPDFEKEVTYLIELLGRYPLALSQAGAYIKENKLCLSDYITLFENKRKLLLLDSTMPIMDKHEPVYISWEVNIKKLEHHPQGLLALSLLNFASFCGTEQIPKKLISLHLFGNTSIESTLKLNQVVNILRRYSLIKTCVKTVSIHKLECNWIIDRVSEKDRRALLRKTINNLQKTLPRKYYESYKNLHFLKSVIPHLSSLLAHSQHVLDESECIPLIVLLGNYHYMVGNYSKAKQYINSALMSIKSLPIIGISQFETLHNLGVCYLFTGEYRKAECILKKLLQRKERVYGIDSVETVSETHYLGKIYFHLGKYENARKLLEKALAKKECFYGKEHIDTTHTLHHLGKVYFHLGRYNDAEKLLRRALIRKEAFYGKNNIKTTHTRRYLGSLYSYNGLDAKAIQILKEVLKKNQNFYGADHVETAHVEHMLARSYIKLKNYSAAKRLLEHSITIHKNFFSLFHTKTANVLSTLGHLYLCQRRYEEALKTYKLVLNLVDSNCGNKSLFVAKSHANLGEVYLLLEQYQKGEKHLQKALKILDNHFSENKLVIAKVECLLGLLKGKQKDFANAKIYIESALKIFSSCLPVDHQIMNMTKSHLDNIKNRKELKIDKIVYETPLFY